MSGSKRIECATKDGVTLRGDFFKAEREAAPIVVMANGFSLVKELCTGFAAQFKEAGFSALTYDYRNYGSSDGFPRQETDLNQQASDFHDVVTAAMDLPGVDRTKVVMWGIGHGGSVAMIAAGNDARIKAVIFHAPFPSGKLDVANFPEGLLDRAWQEREQRTRTRSTAPGYAKVWRDWLKDGDGVETGVFIRGVAAYYLSHDNKTLAEAAGTPWENRVTLQSFINLAGVEPQDQVYKIRHPALYVVNEADPFAAPPDVHRKIFDRMDGNALFKVIPSGDDVTMTTQLSEGIKTQIAWLKSQL